MTDATAAPPKPASPRREIWQQFRSHKGALFGLIVLGIQILAVLIGPLSPGCPEKLSFPAGDPAVRTRTRPFRFPMGHRPSLAAIVFPRMLLASPGPSWPWPSAQLVIAIIFWYLIGTLGGLIPPLRLAA